VTYGLYIRRADEHVIEKSTTSNDSPPDLPQNVTSCQRVREATLLNAHFRHSDSPWCCKRSFLLRLFPVN